MQLIRCTAKLQKEMGLKKADLMQDEPGFSCMGPWHANLIYIDRRKCVLFVNDKTLFNFIVADVSRTQIRQLSELFIGTLHCVLVDEGLKDSTIEKISHESHEIRYTKSSSKSILGSMNDLAFQYKRLIQEAGGVHSYRVPSIIKRLNHIPIGAISFKYPIETLRALYADSPIQS